MKKKIIIVLTAFTLLLTLVGCSMQLKVDGAVKMTVLQGSTGKQVEITDESTVKRITQGITEHEFTNAGHDQDNEGFAYVIAWYGSDGKMMDEISILNGNRISYNGYFYDKENCDCMLPLPELSRLFPESLPE